MNWVPLNNSSHYSLLKSLSKGSKLAEKAKSLNISSIALNDDGVLSGVPSFIKACKEKKIKPINGITMYVDGYPIKLLAKNLDGWKKLIKITSLSNAQDKLQLSRPTLLSTDLINLGDDIIAFSGQLGSEFHEKMFVDPKIAFLAHQYDDVKGLVVDNWKTILSDIINKYQSIFGKDNFYVSIEMFDKIHSMQILGKALRYVCKANNVKCIATNPSYYSNKQDASDQRVLVSTDRDVVLSKLENSIINSDDVYDLRFLKSNAYYIPTYDEMLEVNTEEELKNTLEINEKCLEYNIFSNPRIPIFDCGKLSQDEFLRQQCRNGWKTRISNVVPKDKILEYTDRVNRELKVIEDASLAGYFLIVQDYCNFAKGNDWLMAPGRGSGGGCLVSYLTGITELDPIQWGLSFERFYNAGRNTPGNISLPDIDCDFPVNKREQVIEYIRNRYGVEYVSQMVTFARMQGRGALKDVFRAHEACTFDMINKINESIPDEAEISDQLQLMREENDGEASIIQWALENNERELAPYCRINGNGEYEGEFSRYFAQAKRLEGTKRSQGKHAAGVVISMTKLNEIAPMVYDKSTGLSIAGLEMNDLDKLGCVKFDILGVACLDKLMDISKLLRGDYD